MVSRAAYRVFSIVVMFVNFRNGTSGLLNYICTWTLF